jgi:hypothetical protein
MAVNEVVDALGGAFPRAQVVIPDTDVFTTLNTSYLLKAQAELQPKAISHYPKIGMMFSSLYVSSGPMRCRAA